MKGIANNRFQRQKAIARAKKKWDNWISGKYLLQAKNHRTLCSCSMCGNPRRHFGTRTISERRKDIRDKDRIAEATDGYN